MRNEKPRRETAAQTRAKRNHRANGLGRVQSFGNIRTRRREHSIATVKRPPRPVSRSLSLEKPVSELLDDYCKFVDCTPDYVANFAMKKMLARDPEHKKSKASRNSGGPVAVEAATRRPA